MKARHVTSLIILLTALSLTACGDETDIPTDEATNAATSASATEPTPEAALPEASDEAPGMVCYDISTHTLTEDATQEDCESKGFMWVPASSGHS